jgi:hypothetical protein
MARTSGALGAGGLELGKKYALRLAALGRSIAAQLLLIGHSPRAAGRGFELFTFAH